MDKFQICKLRGRSNFTVWKLQIESSLQFHDFEGILTGNIKAPAGLPPDANNQQRKEHEALSKQFKKANGFAITLITTTVEDEPLQLIMMLKTAKEMWDKLGISYEQKSEQRLEQLYIQLLEYKMAPSDSIATHISKLQKLWLELNEESYRIDSCHLPETLLLTRILSTLPEEYFEFRTTWESIPRDQRSIEYLLERLSMVETRLSKQQSVVTNSSSSALVADRRQGGCSHAAEGASVKSSTAGNKKNTPTSTKVKKDYSKVRCYVCNELGHTKYKCPRNEKKSDHSHRQQNQALYGEVLFAESANDENIWVADTGASHHMTKSKDFFVSYTAFSEPKPIMLGNQKLMLAYGKGDIQVEAFVDNCWNRHYLQNVWYVPDVVKNLFSVPQTADKGMEYWLNKDTCRITKNGTTLVVGKRHCGLYKLVIRVITPESPAEVYVANKVESLQVWHERLCHQSKQYVEKYLKKHGIKYVRDNQLCEACILGKQHRLSFGTRMAVVEKPGDLVHSDVCGPMQEDSFRGARYFVCFKDEFSKYRDVYFMKKKSEVADKLKCFLAKAKTAGHAVKELLTDGGGEFDNHEVQQITVNSGLNHRIVMPYTPEQNGSAERENRTLVEAARSMLQSTKLPNKLWAECVNTAAYVLNRTGPTKIVDKTPYELWNAKEASIDHLKVFGTECFVHVPKQKRQKFDAKSVKGYLVGYCGDRDGYRVYVPEQDDVIISRDVLFKEEQLSATDSSCSEEAEVDVALQDDGNSHINVDASKQALRDRNLIQLPARYSDFAMFADCSEPNSFTEAMQSENSHDWQCAMDDEMKSLAESNTWELVEKPEDRLVVDNRWVYRVKMNLGGTVDKFKARLVAKGFSQQAGVDYTETFSPVARFDTIRAVLSVAASEKLKLAHFDVKTAFLNGELDEVIYMRQPVGYDDGTGRVCKLSKSLYGLKQAPRCWNKKFKDFLERYGLKVSEADPCLFYSVHDGHKLIIALYVDDGLVAAQNDDDLNMFLSELCSEFCVTVSPAGCFLGLQIRQLEDGSVTVSQENYIKKILQRFNMSECNPVTTPSDKMTAVEASTCSKGTVPYREAVGSLMYLAIGTRPDIAYAVSSVSQALEKPSQHDWLRVKRIFKYLKGTYQMGIVYDAGYQSGVFTAYSDADYAGDVSTRRSTSGVVCLHMGGPVSWSSQRQKSVALSTTEAEFIAASEAAKEIVWLSRLFSEISVLTSIPVLKIDNMSAVKLVKNPAFHKRSKHIEVRYYFVREKYDEGQLVVEHVPGDEQIADIMTKPLQKCRYQVLRDMMGVMDLNVAIA